MYEILVKLLQQNNCKPSDVSKATGIPASTFTDWKKGRSVPKQEKLQKIADYFGVSLEYLMTGKEKNGHLPSQQKKKRTFKSSLRTPSISLRTVQG